MSYDYNALVSAIANHRRLAEAAQTQDMDTNTTNNSDLEDANANISANANTNTNTNSDAMNTDNTNTVSTIHKEDQKEQEHLEKALEAFEQLSSHCPMTPLLWMQYAATTARLIERAFLGCSSGGDSTLMSTSISQDDRSAAARSALETRLQTVQLGLQEFPGSALLQWYHVSLLKQHLELLGGHNKDKDKDNDDDNHGNDTMEKMEAGMDSALEQVGLGSHRNEGDWVAALYRIQVSYYIQHHGGATDRVPTNKVVECFSRRAEIPMKDANDTILQEFQTGWARLCRKYCLELPLSSVDVAKVETGRRREAKQLARFSTWEDEVDVAMQKEGILARDQIHIVPSGGDTDGGDTEPNWDVILQSGNQRYGMGLGGQETANAFVKYALAFHKCKVPRKNDGDDDNYDATPDPDRPLSGSELSKLALAVYERGVAECPTVESIWLSYVRCLVEMVQRGDPFASSLQSVVSRAVRNCPYSLALVQQKLNVALLLAERGAFVLDPDTLMETVREAIGTKFLPGPKLFLDLYMTAIMTVKRRILFLLAQGCTPSTSGANAKVLAYDDAESLPYNSKTEGTASASNGVDPESLQEVNDLCDDIVDMYDGANTLLLKQHPKWTEGRSLLWKERAQTETLLLAPLRAIDEKVQSSSSSLDTDEALVYLEKAVRTHAPPHPDSYSVYIQHFMYSVTPSTETDVLTKLRRVRGLFQKAVNAVGKPKTKAAAVSVPTEPPARDFETAISCLCHDWMLFEGAFGSERSRSRASKVIEKKLHKAKISSVPTKAPAASADAKGAEAKVSSDQVAKRKLEDRDDAEQPAKKQKTEEQVDETTSPKGTTENAIATKKTLPKVHVGNLEYPAHPFTVRVSNLSLDTEDMDLVDAFRSKCGAIVHAKIIREKHLHQGKSISKGCGLVQFEERDAVEKALELDDVLGIKEKVINVERSHVPASSIVPPGMHRVNPMGEGKSSKRNQKRREQKSGVAEVDKNKTANLDQPPSSEKKEEPKEEKKAPAKAQSIEFNPLAFRPRSVGRSKVQRKVKLSLGDKESEGSKG
jgi:RNA recognition motif-containing protein